MSDQVVRVLVVDAQAPFRIAARAVVRATAGFEVVGEAKSGEVLLSTYDSEDLPDDARRCGAAAYVHKEQFGPDVLEKVWAEDDGFGL